MLVKLKTVLFSGVENQLLRKQLKTGGNWVGLPRIFHRMIGFGRKNYLHFCIMPNWFRARKLPVLYQGIGFGRGNYQFCTKELGWRTKKKNYVIFLLSRQTPPSQPTVPVPASPHSLNPFTALFNSGMVFISERAGSSLRLPPAASA